MRESGLEDVHPYGREPGAWWERLIRAEAEEYVFSLPYLLPIVLCLLAVMGWGFLIVTMGSSWAIYGSASEHVRECLFAGGPLLAALIVLLSIGLQGLLCMILRWDRRGHGLIWRVNRRLGRRCLASWAEELPRRLFATERPSCLLALRPPGASARGLGEFLRFAMTGFVLISALILLALGNGWLGWAAGRSTLVLYLVWGFFLPNRGALAPACSALVALIVQLPLRIFTPAAARPEALALESLCGVLTGLLVLRGLWAFLRFWTRRDLFVFGDRRAFLLLGRPGPKARLLPLDLGRPPEVVEDDGGWTLSFPSALGTRLDMRLSHVDEVEVLRGEGPEAWKDALAEPRKERCQPWQGRGKLMAFGFMTLAFLAMASNLSSRRAVWSLVPAWKGGESPRCLEAIRRLSRSYPHEVEVRLVHCVLAAETGAFDEALIERDRFLAIQGEIDPIRPLQALVASKPFFEYCRQGAVLARSGWTLAKVETLVRAFRVLRPQGFYPLNLHQSFARLAGFDPTNGGTEPPDEESRVFLARLFGRVLLPPEFSYRRHFGRRRAESWSRRALELLDGAAEGHEELKGLILFRGGRFGEAHRQLRAAGAEHRLLSLASLRFVGGRAAEALQAFEGGRVDRGGEPSAASDVAAPSVAAAASGEDAPELLHALLMCEGGRESEGRVLLRRLGDSGLDLARLMAWAVEGRIPDEAPSEELMDDLRWPSWVTDDEVDLVAAIGLVARARRLRRVEGQLEEARRLEGRARSLLKGLFPRKADRRRPFVARLLEGLSESRS